MNHLLTPDAPIPYDVFSQSRSEAEAGRARKMESIYHKGQEKIWDGQEVLSGLLELHGGVHVRPDQREALIYLLSLVMWGEYAAWRVAAQLADRLSSLEARMAATAQSHDEARHFYVLHDYLKAMGAEPVLPRKWGKRLIEMTLRTEDLSCKLLGMQLMIESIALSIFNNLKESKLEPVLAGLMPYYEKDEARHVGLGTQLLPATMRSLSLSRQVSFNRFVLTLYISSLNELKELEADLFLLGMNPRGLITVAKDRLYQVFRDIREAGGRRTAVSIVEGVAEGMMEVYFPAFADGPSLPRRVQGVGRAFRNGLRPPDQRSDYSPTLRYQV